MPRANFTPAHSYRLLKRCGISGSKCKWAVSFFFTDNGTLLVSTDLSGSTKQMNFVTRKSFEISTVKF